ncbi:conserved hypothetical protein [Ricinus communis]|uniref:Uncharacterized protein n=1 Tax=Ricinus communis TaxID=3988 RepID=B9T7Q6_RICCO|nr:conserved hypothetical protein [Ricinus communis]
MAFCVQICEFCCPFVSYRDRHHKISDSFYRLPRLNRRCGENKNGGSFLVKQEG